MIWFLLVCRLPMRNWNPSDLGTPTSWGSFVGYLWGIETNISLPSLRLKESFVGYLWGIETQGFLLLWSKSGLVCRLPMRNWNSIALIVAGWISQFVGYLWGIETGNVLVAKPLRDNVCRLPMRNWNISFPSSSNRCSSVCRLPMRNWNSRDRHVGLSEDGRL